MLFPRIRTGIRTRIAASPHRTVRSDPAFARTPLLLLAAATLLLQACADGAPTAPDPTLPPHFSHGTGGHIVINEIMADPNRASDADGEWIELYNWGGTDLDVGGWSIASNDGSHTIGGSLLVPAGGYVVLGRDGNTKRNGGVTVTYVYGGAISLANAGDWVALRDGTGSTVDSVAWTSTSAGVARGLSDASADNADANGVNWHDGTSTFGGGSPSKRDFGTPGAQNDGWIDPGAGADPEPVTVVVTPSAATIDEGATQAFSATAYDAGGAPVATTFTWSSSNASIATVDAGGVASGVSAGGAQIRATASNGVWGEAALTVSDTTSPPPPPPGDAPLEVRILEVGQGDAAYIENGGSVVFIDGGPSTASFGAHLDALGLNGDTVDVVVISHAHFDHYSGLRELFDDDRGITVRYVFENGDASTASTLATLRDSIDAAVARGETILRDTDDPCGDGSAVCTISLRGGALLHVMRPDPGAGDPNNRSAPVKLVGPDSASFTMWFAGDAEHEAIGWFDTGADYDGPNGPGMDVDVLKGDHHGSCNGVTSRYLDLLTPDWVTFGVSGSNSYGHVHGQTKDLLASRAIPWYRTDTNGSITFTSPGTPGGGYSVSVERGSASMNGSADAYSAQSACNNL